MFIQHLLASLMLADNIVPLVDCNKRCHRLTLDLCKGSISSAHYTNMTGSYSGTIYTVDHYIGRQYKMWNRQAVHFAVCLIAACYPTHAVDTVYISDW